MPKSPKILTVYYKHKPGGFCKRLQMKIEAYLDKGWHVHYVAVEAFPYSHPNLFPHILPTPFQNHDSLPFWIYFFLTAPFYVLATGLKEKVDLISVFSSQYAFICGLARWVLNVPMLTFIRFLPQGNPTPGPHESSLLTRMENCIEKMGLIFSDRILANADAVLKAVTQWVTQAAGKTATLYNHIEEIDFDRQEQKRKLIEEFSLAANSFIIATSGVLQKRKNLDCLVRAFASVKHPRSVLLIIGDGEQRNPLEQLAADLKVSDRIRFTGWRQDVLQLIQGADLFIFASSQEGMANSLLEAVAFGIPCLVSNIPENQEVITHSEQHFSPDHPEMLAEKINRIMEDETYYDTLRETTLVEKKRFLFDWQGEIIRHVEALLQRGKK